MSARASSAGSSRQHSAVVWTMTAGLVALSFLASITTAAEDASDNGGLVAYWPLDEGTGRAIDELSGKSSEGLVQTDGAWEQTERGMGLTFDGKTTYVKIPTSPHWDYAPGVKGDLTICFWVKVDKEGFVVDHYFGGIPGAWGFFAEGGRLAFSTYIDKPWEGPGRRRSGDMSYPIERGKWGHVVLVWHRGDDGWLKGYLNGTLVGTLEGLQMTSSLVKDLYVGSRTGGDRPFQGNVRDLAIFNRALSAEAVAKIHSDGVKLATPVAISSLRTDKLAYKPGQSCSVQLRVRNTTGQAQAMKASVEIVSMLGDRRMVGAGDATLPPQGSKVWTYAVDLKGLEYGCEVRAEVSQGDKVVTAKSDYFSVADTIWKVGIGSGWGSGLHTGLGTGCLEIPDAARRMYANYFELFFWSPCDWALHKSPTKVWWSGQASYLEDEDNLKELIKRAHGHGLNVVMYASCNPAGPFGWEAARRHPEWFPGALRGKGWPAQYSIEALDHWNDPAWRKEHPGNPGWYTVGVDLRRPEAVDYGIDRIIESAKAYGWDGVRFDGHYTVIGNDELSARNMRRLKERTWEKLPDFVFGYNYGRAPEWLGGVNHEIREGMAGGGVYLQEGIRAWWCDNAKYTSWEHYATNELRICKLIQGMGGYYHCMWEEGGDPSLPKRYYKFVYGLIAGGHPAIYDGSAPLCPSWGAFMTRWSSMLWHVRLVKAEDQVERLNVANSAVQWKPLLQEYVASPTRKFVILHLVSPSASDEIAKTACRDPVGSFEVSYRPPERTTVARVRLIRHNSMPFDSELKPTDTPKGLRVTVPGLEHWAMVVWELNGKFQEPPAPPRFSEPVDAAKLAWSPDEELVKRLDPLQPDTVEDAGPDVTVIPLTTGGVNIGRVTTTDDGSPQRVVQWRGKDRTSGKIGRYWSGPYPPGKYRLSIRLKWVDAEATPAPQSLAMRILAEKGAELIPGTVTFVTPGHPQAPQGAVAMGDRGKYQDYVIGEIDLTAREYVTFDGTASTEKAGDNALYAEKIRIELLHRYTDVELAKSNPVQKPDGLRAPNGAAPQKVLLVRGLFSKEYGVDQAVKCDGTYKLPEKYEDLYAYDAVILANVSFEHAPFAARAMFKDYVCDGGRLVILGGPYTLGQGQIKDTFVGDILPVELAGPTEIVRAPRPLPLGAAPDKAYGDGAVVLWRHEVKAKPSASILAYAGAQPIAFRRQEGKGLVCVFAGTVLGEADGGIKCFWECPSWQRLLRQMAAE